MTYLPRILAGALALALTGFALFYIFDPAGAAAANGMAPETSFGMTNMRANGAGMLMLAVLSAIGAARQKWEFVAPAALYFLLVAVVRVLGLTLDGFDANTIRGLLLAIVLFAVAEVSLQLMRRKSA
jgi:hypothetical protein